MVSVQSSGTVTLGDFSIEAPTMTSFGERVPDAGIPIRNYAPGSADPLTMWKTQPSLRKVVGFIARNCAVIPWHAYERVSDTDRQRMAGGPIEAGLMKPRRFLTGYRMWRNIVIDACLYDRYCVALIGGKLRRISPRLLELDGDAFGDIERVGVRAGRDVIDLTDFPLAVGSGWGDLGVDGVSPLLTLRNILDEQTNAVSWRRAQWRRSPKLSGLLKRPVGAKWKDDKTRDRFLETWKSWRDTNAGGTPILEDGMEYEVLDTIKPIDAKDIEGRQLTDAEVASAFHIPPELVGARAGTFSNIAAFRQMLYGPALGPVLEELQQAVNAEIVPALAGRSANAYAELDREAALNGSFLEQAEIFSKATGGPFLLRSEARAMRNLPFVEGTDELITPLNVLEGGLASPHDTRPTSTPIPDGGTA